MGNASRGAQPSWSPRSRPRGATRLRRVRRGGNYAGLANAATIKPGGAHACARTTDITGVLGDATMKSLACPDGLVLQCYGYGLPPDEDPGGALVYNLCVP